MPMFHSAEVRWFFHQTVPADVFAWFCGNRRLDPETRPDDYLVIPNCETIGVKMRDAKKFEVKAQTAAPKLREWGSVRGRVDEWVKWSFDDAAFAAAGAAMLSSERWVRVKKSRYLRKFSADADSIFEVDANRTPFPGAGCNVELTSVQLPDGDDWFSFSFEAFGPPIRTVTILNATIELFLSRPIPGVRLDASTSLNYPAWLAATGP